MLLKAKFKYKDTNRIKIKEQTQKWKKQYQAKTPQKKAREAILTTSRCISKQKMLLRIKNLIS